jgi:hypothetical protein
MRNDSPVLDAATAVTYIGQTVLLELRWDDEPDSYWRLSHIVGAVLPMEGIYDQAYFLVLHINNESPFPTEIFLGDIRTIRAIRHRDRQRSGNVLGRMTRPIPLRSGAALPARRNGFIVPSNGSTGAAHP